MYQMLPHFQIFPVRKKVKNIKNDFRKSFFNAGLLYKHKDQSILC